jgi:hypothetical protein
MTRLYLSTWPPTKQREQWEGLAWLPSRSSTGMAEPPRLRILLSYWYYRDSDLDALFTTHFTPPYPEVFADSGAFSAMTQGVAITPESYAGWLQRWAHWFTAYANLDVIMDAEATRTNQQRLEDLGLTPLPCFHVRSAWSYLEHYLAHYPYIALGVAGMQGRKPALMAWLTRCFRLAGARAVYHGFALTSWEVMSTFPWYSVDSSSWGQGFRYGQVPVFCPRRRRFVKLRLRDRRAWYREAVLVRSYGFDPEDFVDPARYDRAKVCALSALAYLQAEAFLRERHGLIYLPERGGKAGTRMPLVDGTAQMARSRQATKGLKIHLVTADSPSSNMGAKALAEALGPEVGLKLHLADAYGHSGRDLTAADAGVKTYLARGGDRRDLLAVHAGLQAFLASTQETP